MGKFIEIGSSASDLKETIDKVKNFREFRAILLNHSKICKKENRLSLVITYKETAPNVSIITKKHWPILQINKTRKVF